MVIRLKKAFLLVSHSLQLTDGLKEMIEQMSQSETVEIFSLGGMPDGTLGSDPTKITAAVAQTEPDTLLFVFADIGSAVLNAEMAKDFLDEADQARYFLVDAPLVEGAFAAAITAGVTDDQTVILQEAKKAGTKGWETL